MPDAPVRFSSTTDWPSSACSFSPTARPMMSEALPAVAPEMSLMVLLGKPWAITEGATKLAAQAKAARGRARVDNASRMGLGFMVRVLRVD